MTTPLASRHWVVHDPRKPGPLEHARVWSDELGAHLGERELIELLHAAVVVGRECSSARLAAALRQLARYALTSFECHEQWRDQPADARTVSLDEQTFLTAVHHHGLALDSAIVVLGARLRKATLAPTDKLYPAELLRQLLTAPSPPPRGKPFVHAAAQRVAQAIPARWRDAVDALTSLDARASPTAAWPEPVAAARAALALLAIEPQWDVEALHVRERQRRLGKLASGVRRDLEHMTRWCVATRHTLERLASAHGWLRLLLDYLLEIRGGAARIIGEARPDAPTSTFIDVAMHELAHLVGTVDADARTTPRAIIDRDGGGASGRMRLSRGRERCLARWTLAPPSPEWDDADFGELLAALGLALDGGAREGA